MRAGVRAVGDQASQASQTQCRQGQAQRPWLKVKTDKLLERHATLVLSFALAASRTQLSGSALTASTFQHRHLLTAN